MLRTNLMVNRLLLVAVGAALFTGVGAWRTLDCVAQENNAPPSGYRALFNGKDLAGWTALETQDPRVTAALSEDEKKKFASKIDIS
jgi:hypothetical protein